MKYMVVSDIHGSAYYCGKMAEIFKISGADRLLLLGDLLYHGPRNDFPKDYEPQAVVAILNDLKKYIYCVRGNCDSEVDQMLLEFPIMSDYCVLSLSKRAVFATHGHIFNKDNMPPIQSGDVILHGHTHVLEAEKFKDCYILNPGSISIPKGGNSETYGMLTDEEFMIYNLDNELVKKIKF